MTFAMLAVERLRSDELQALAAHEQASSLNEVLSEVASLGRHAIDARTTLGEARKRLIIAKHSDASDLAAAQIGVVDAQTLLDIIRDRARTMREIKSVLQTLLRAIP